MLNFTPDGLATGFFAALAPYLPPPPTGAQPPLLWGSEQHVRELFGDAVTALRLERRAYVERADSPRAYQQFCNETFGPMVAIANALAGQPERAAAFDRDFLAFATRGNSGTPGGPAEYRYEYLLVTARKR
jgi:2-polyprenyl-6-hydroxyphenyl methylase/3-demethylubiquinone-9 3-methyltransferase